MITRYALLFASLTFFSLQGVCYDKRLHQPVLRNASFFITQETVGKDGYPLEDYYTCFGKYLGTYNYGAYQLDPQAPKPQVTKCEFIRAQHNKPCRIFFSVGNSAQRLVFNYDPQTRRITYPQCPNFVLEIQNGQSLVSIAEWLGIDVSMIGQDQKSLFHNAVSEYKEQRK